MNDRGHLRTEGVGGKVAGTGPRPPVAILVSIVVSLPLFPYNWHLMLHILGAVLFLGNITVTAAWMTWAVGQKDTRVAAFASAGVNKADRWFTSPGMILLLLNGLALTNLAWGGWLGSRCHRIAGFSSASLSSLRPGLSTVR